MEADVSSLACILLSKINCTTSKIDSNIKFIMTQINSECETWKGQLGTNLWQRHGWFLEDAMLFCYVLPLTRKHGLGS